MNVNDPLSTGVDAGQQQPGSSANQASSASGSDLAKQPSQTGEGEMGDDVPVAAVHANSAEIHTKNKTSLVSSPDHSRLLEL